MRFADPIIDHDRAAGRRPPLPGVANYSAVEYTKHPHGCPPTAAGLALKTYVDSMKDKKLKPEDIPGDYILNLQHKEPKTLADNHNLIGAQIYGKMYKDLYSRERFCTSNTEAANRWLPGRLFTGPILEQLFDDNIGIDDSDRTTTIRGSVIGKDRVDLLMRAQGSASGQVSGQVISGTSISGKGKPPAQFQDEYIRIVHEDEELHLDAEEAGRIPIIRFRGASDLFKKITYLRFTRTNWVNLAKTPNANEGTIVYEDFEKVADLMELKLDHEFRAEGRSLIAKRDQVRAHAEEAREARRRAKEEDHRRVVGVV